MTGTVDERLAALPPGPYRVEWPAEQGGLFTVWGRPKEDGGWAIPLVASGVQSVMEWLADHLNRLADSGVALVEREALDKLRALSDAATPGEWARFIDSYDDATMFVTVVRDVPDAPTGRVIVGPTVAETITDADAALIVAAVNYVRAALRESR